MSTRKKKYFVDPERHCDTPMGRGKGFEKYGNKRPELSEGVGLLRKGGFGVENKKKGGV